MMTKRSDIRLHMACYLLDNGKKDSKLASSYLLIDCLRIHLPTANSLHVKCDRAVCFPDCSVKYRPLVNLIVFTDKLKWA